MRTTVLRRQLQHQKKQSLACHSAQTAGWRSSHGGPASSRSRAPDQGAGTAAAMEETTTIRQCPLDSRKGSAARVRAIGPSTLSWNICSATSVDSSSTAACWLAPARITRYRLSCSSHSGERRAVTSPHINRFPWLHGEQPQEHCTIVDR